MRLSDVLSKPLSEEYMQVDGFIGTARLARGKTRKIEAGIIGLNFFCQHCNETLTFCSGETLHCIGVNNRKISIDAALKCPRCTDSTVEVWFLVVSEDDIHSLAPKIRILKRSLKLSDSVSHDKPIDNFAEFLDKAHRAYYENLGAGSIIYLRKILEQITVTTATVSAIDTKKTNGKRKNFKDLLKEVDEAKSIIPREFSENGYQLYSELSEVLHGSYDEDEGLRKYKALRRLVIGILDNIKNNSEMMTAIAELGWTSAEVDHE